MNETAPPGRHNENPFARLRHFLDNRDRTSEPNQPSATETTKSISRRTALKGIAGTAGSIVVASAFPDKTASASTSPPRQPDNTPHQSFIEDIDTPTNHPLTPPDIQIPIQRTVENSSPDAGIAEYRNRLADKVDKLQTELGILPKDLPETEDEIKQELENIDQFDLKDHRRWVVERRAVLAAAAIADKEKWVIDPKNGLPKGYALARELLTPLTEKYARDLALQVIWNYRQTGEIEDLPPLDVKEIAWAKNPNLKIQYDGKETVIRVDPRMLAFCHDAQEKITEVLTFKYRRAQPELTEKQARIKAALDTPDVGTLIGVMSMETTYDLYYDGNVQSLANIGENNAYACLAEQLNHFPSAIDDFIQAITRINRSAFSPVNPRQTPSSPSGAIGPQIMSFNLKRLTWDEDLEKGIPEANPFDPLGAVIYVGLFLTEAGYKANSEQSIGEALYGWNKKRDEVDAILAIRKSYLKRPQPSSRGGIRPRDETDFQLE